MKALTSLRSIRTGLLSLALAAAALATAAVATSPAAHADYYLPTPPWDLRLQGAREDALKIKFVNGAHHDRHEYQTSQDAVAWSVSTYVGAYAGSFTLNRNAENFVRMRACKANVCSAWTSPTNFGARVIPSAPTNLQARATSATTVQLWWCDTSWRETEYRVYYYNSTLGFGGYVRLPANSTSAVIRVTSGHRYSFHVRGMNGRFSQTLGYSIGGPGSNQVVLWTPAR